jgi:putative hemolysin
LEIDAPLRIYFLFFLFWGLVFFTSSEAALFGLGRLNLQKLKEEEHPRHSLIDRLLSRPRQLLISLLIGNEAINVAISSLASALFIGLWGDAAKWLAIPVVVFIILLFGEVIPKTIAVNYPDKIAPLVAGPVDQFAAIVSPLRWILEKIVDGVLKLFRVVPESSPPPLTEEFFKELVATSQKEGTLEELEKDLIHRVFRFGDQTVKNIMTPRAAVFVLPDHTQLENAIEALREHRFSRIPVFGENPDNIVGILYAKELLGAPGKERRTGETSLRNFLRKPYFIPPSKKLDDLFREFRKQRIHLAVVVNEYGGLSGIVTLEDLLEELFGEIYDEMDFEREGMKEKRKRQRGNIRGNKTTN